ncbi:hypothetical protein NQZ68_003134 [Dissostichus eleginoides]|nr:hypothetical protein NQZ68_003134 [Dissostichus eleginoides]
MIRGGSGQPSSHSEPEYLPINLPALHIPRMMFQRARLREDTAQHRGPLNRDETIVMWPGTGLGQPALQS